MELKPDISVTTKVKIPPLLIVPYGIETVYFGFSGVIQLGF